jgi:hypothetical protein
LQFVQQRHMRHDRKLRNASVELLVVRGSGDRRYTIAGNAVLCSERRSAQNVPRREGTKAVNRRGSQADSARRHASELDAVAAVARSSRSDGLAGGLHVGPRHVGRQSDTEQRRLAAGTRLNRLVKNIDDLPGPLTSLSTGRLYSIKASNHPQMTQIDADSDKIILNLRKSATSADQYLLTRDWRLGIRCSAAYNFFDP